ncbi:MAG TPA: tetratricopeptide repeat protein [Verrucomicrobiota bacterium]|nr:tetratricopeptide repeat protein [Verrucomicrobiota bacterium]HNU52941.1 tetratricopeptide repeat protein [Verrucomicrobiota bacterium]
MVFASSKDPVLRLTPRRRSVAGLGLIGVWLACWLLGGNAKAAGSFEALFDQANQAYERGQFTNAIAGYQELLDAGRQSAAVHYNLGNAYFRAGKTGRAICHYRLAERLAPRDPDVQANLRFARGTVGAAVAPVPVWRRMLPRLSLVQWTWLTAACWWCFLGLLTALVCLPERRIVLRRGLFAALIALLLASAGLGLRWRDEHARPAAVVVQPDSILRHGPLDESPSLQTLPDGQELTVLDEKDDWLQVSGASRGIGWLRRDRVARVDP